jgi:hypothetical protein
MAVWVGAVVWVDWRGCEVLVRDGETRAVAITSGLAEGGLGNGTVRLGTVGTAAVAGAGPAQAENNKQSRKRADIGLIIHLSFHDAPLIKLALLSRGETQTCRQ